MTEMNNESKIILRTDKLGISFGGLKALNSLNLEVKEHEIYGLIGPNGAGKTTVFNLITGVYQPTFGSFYLEGEKLNGMNQIQINKKGIARTFQNIRLFNNLSVIKNVMVGLANRPEFKCSMFQSVFRTSRHYECEETMRAKAKEILDIFDLLEFRNMLSSSLPYGKQRKLEIARAIATNPKFLLLDEPAAGMNTQETAELVETIKLIRDRFNLSILLIEHDMSLVSVICERLTVLNFGSVLTSGITEDVLNNEEVIRAYLGDD